MVDKDKEIDDAFRMWKRLEKKQDELDAAVDAMISEKTSDGLKKGVTMEEFDKALLACKRHLAQVFSAMDRWRFLVRHKDDAPTEPEVPVDEISPIVSASLSDKLDGVLFSVNYGILAHKVANAIKMSVHEGDPGDVVLCDDH